MIRLAFKPAAVNWGQNSFAWIFWHAACYFLTFTFYKCPNNWVCLLHCWWKYRCRTKEVKTPMFKLWDCSTFYQITIKSSCRKIVGLPRSEMKIEWTSLAKKFADHQLQRWRRAHSGRKKRKKTIIFEHRFSGH